MRSAEPKAPSMWLPYVAVAGCDATADKARALGGQVLSPPTDIPGVGRFAVFADPVGAAIAVLEPLAEDGVAGETVSQATAA
jgi:predicted enzyme related to lactoylglutathione lyase